MSSTNDKTIQSYEAHIQEYVDGTPQVVEGTVKDWIDATLEDLPRDATILELGSAFGRDADYIEGKGFRVKRTDVAPGFVKLLQSQGHQAFILDAINDDLAGPYDLIFADAVLLHFTRVETRSVIVKVFDALHDGGRFAFSLKQGDGDNWSEEKLGAPRYFCYWSKGDIEKIIKQTGFGDVQIKADRSGGTRWLHIIANKGISR